MWQIVHFFVIFLGIIFWWNGCCWSATVEWIGFCFHIMLLHLGLIIIHLWGYLEYGSSFLMWGIWRERNSLTFEGTEGLIRGLKMYFLQTLFGWANPLGNFLFYSLSDLLDRCSIRLDTDENPAFCISLATSGIMHCWVGPLHCSRDPQTYFFNKTFIKNGSYSIIHTFKNYFALVFSIFNF